MAANQPFSKMTGATYAGLLLAALAGTLAACDVASTLPPDAECAALPSAAPTAARSASPPIPALLPVPSPQQQAWQEREMLLFVHFGMNTITGREWGNGKESPAFFNPSGLDARQWAQVARDAGFNGLIFTAKHIDGFSLWPSRHTGHSVHNSPWRRDVVRAVADASREAGLAFGLYVPLWDRHEPTYGTPAYDDFFVNQLTELTTGYGPLFEVWIDGAHGEGIDIHPYDLRRYWQTIRRHQPDALIANSGPDVRWVGNEKGVAAQTQWSDVEGRWHPAECDVPNRPGWFWRPTEDDQIKSLAEHLDLYFSSVGRNCTLLLNVPANADGVLPAPDVQRLLEFRAALDRIFAHNLAAGKPVAASATRADHPGWQPENVVDGDPATFWTTDDGVVEGWIEIDLGRARFNVVEIEEALSYGQRVEAYRVEAWTGGVWRTVSRGTTIGHKKLDRTARVVTGKVRLVIERARANPAIRHVGLYLDAPASASCRPPAR